MKYSGKVGVFLYIKLCQVTSILRDIADDVQYDGKVSFLLKDQFTSSAE
jgi:hypothetical protein